MVKVFASGLLGSLFITSTLASTFQFLVDSECSAANAKAINQTFSEVRKLTQAVLPPPSGGDSSFVVFFGIDYVDQYTKNFNNIFKNLQIADNLFAGVGPRTVASVTCKDVQNRCNTVVKDSNGNTFNKKIGAYVANPSTETAGPIKQATVVFCPLIFEGGFQHLSDIEKNQQPTTNMNAIPNTMERILLHEVMHIVPQLTGFSRKINDNIFCLDGQSAAKGTCERAYGPTKCAEYVGFLQDKNDGRIAKGRPPIPPVQAIGNSDNYAMFTLSAYYSKFWNLKVLPNPSSKAKRTPDTVLEELPAGIPGKFLTRFIKRQDMPAANETDDYVDDGDIFDDVIGDTCTDGSGPDWQDCLAINIPTDDTRLGTSQGSCFQSADNLKWCDFFTSGTCQVSMVWPKNTGNLDPTVSHSDLAQTLASALEGSPCAEFKSDDQLIPGSPSEGTPFEFNIQVKRVGSDPTF